VNAVSGDMSTGEQPTAMLVIGLTGPIGCGKSAIAGMLGDVGGSVIDADQLARRATEHGAPGLGAIQERFGEHVFIPSGALDRAALADVVFRDPAALRDLEAIVHPEVRRRIEEQLAAAADERIPFVVIEAIKLVEGGLAARCDEVWLVECSPASQRIRLRERGLEESDMEQRITAQGEGLSERLADQLPGRTRIRRLLTDGPLEAVREQVEDALADALAPYAVGEE